MPDLPWLVYAIPLSMVALIAGAAIYKYLQVRAAAHWPSVQGRVVVSTSEVRKVKTFDDDREDGHAEEQRNFAKIIYEYTARGRGFRHDRVSIGEDLGNFEVAETIARYPVGKPVTVYYNPRDPQEAVLERDVPKGLWGCVIWMVVGGVAIILGSFFGFNQLTQYVRSLMPYPDRAPMVVALSAMGLFTLWFGYVFRKQAMAASGWPLVTAKIDASKLEQFQGRLSSDREDSRTQTLYRPAISYSYRHNGVNYSGDQVSLGAKVTSNSDSYAKKIIAKYPAGTILSVHVNPQNASESVLKPSGGAAWFIWSIGLGLFGLAYFISQQP